MAKILAYLQMDGDIYKHRMFRTGIKAISYVVFNNNYYNYNSYINILFQNLVYIGTLPSSSAQCYMTM
jgi:hypothetical protein